MDKTPPSPPPAPAPRCTAPRRGAAAQRRTGHCDKRRRDEIELDAADSDGTEKEIAELRRLLRTAQDTILELKERNEKLERKTVEVQLAAEKDRADCARQRDEDMDLDAVAIAAAKAVIARLLVKRRRLEPSAPPKPDNVA